MFSIMTASKNFRKYLYGVALIFLVGDIVKVRSFFLNMHSKSIFIHLQAFNILLHTRYTLVSN